MQMKLMVVAYALALSGCLGDALKPMAQVTGGYCLERWDEGATFYTLVACSPTATLRGTTDNGILDGNVRSIGWNERFIVVKRFPLGPPEDWLIVDTREQRIDGPYSDRGFAERLAATEALAGIRIYAVSEAWRVLKRERNAGH